MALVLADRVRETTTVTGTGTATLLGAVSGYQSFSAVGNANTTYYVIANQSATEWEVGIGTYTSSGTTLSRDTVLSSSNSGSLVDFSAGTKDVFVDYPAGKAVYENAAGNVDGYPITGGTINNTTIGATTPSTGVFTTLTATGSGAFGTTVSGTNRLVVKGGASSQCFRVEGASGGFVNLDMVGNRTSGNLGGLRALYETDANEFFGIYPQATKSNTFFNLGSGSVAPTTQFALSNTASAVNYHQLTGSATGSGPIHSVAGSDTNIDLNLISKGTGNLVTNNNSASGALASPFVIKIANNQYSTVVGVPSKIDLFGNDYGFGLTANQMEYISRGNHSFFGIGSTKQFQVSYTASAVNYVQVTGGATTKAVIQSAQGSDSNISYVTQSKGTGAIDLAAGSSGVNISNGGTVTAITRTASSGGYTSAPTIAISAPTTAGGVQATVTGYIWINTVTLSSGGTGYTVGDVLSIAGGSYVTNPVRITVTGVSAGVITTFTFASFDLYNTAPSNPASVTGGTGSGATFTLNFSNSSTFTITNAGSGYVEQPTVTFSGGGGSGAAAFAVIGSQSIIKGIGTSSGTISNQSIMFQTPSGNSLLLRDPNQATPDAHLMMQATASGYGILVAEGSNANASLFVGAKGSGSVRFSTSGTTLTEQLRVSHTASAVNYVQVTGAATTLQPVISAQGSDTNVGLILTSKGTSSFQIRTNNNNNVQMFVTHTASSVNWVQMTGAVAGSAPVYTVAGADTNIDLTLTPKGTGNVRFGTYTGTILTPTGYVEIKDSGGTVRRLLVG